MPLRYLPGVGPVRAEHLRRLGLSCVQDLLSHFPRRYEDRRTLTKIGDTAPGQTVVLAGSLRGLRQRQLSRGRHLLTGTLRDETGSIELVWFNQPYLVDVLSPGVLVHVHGPIKERRGRLQVVAPEYEVDTGEDDVEGGPSLHLQRIVPIYQLTRGLQQRFLRRLIHRVLEGGVPDEEGPYLLFHPEGPTREEAFRWIHFPRSLQDVDVAKRRFVFEEYFRFGSVLCFRRAAVRSRGGVCFDVSSELDHKIRSVFPFELTADQNRVVTEVAQDLRGPAPMYRLLQGDVGTGKTAIAIYALLVAVRNGYQGAILAPTELLAEQHYRTVTRYLSAYPVRTGLLTSSVSPATRKELLRGMAEGRYHIVVGTHALVQDSVAFSRLGLVVIDEQHRFGVRERLKMRKKGRDPHLLVMTATPIPRSLCLTVFGDLDLSVLRERPEGRQPVKTHLVGTAGRRKALELVRRELQEGRQAYFVYPLIEESEAVDLPAAVEAHRRLQEEVFPEYPVGLIHGRLPAREKDACFERFRRGDYRVLATTVVVEVGVDVPNATVMFIEDGSRFGLAQLHQLRGRVGRGKCRGHCLVCLETSSRDARARLKAFAETEDGFLLAEEDLRQRGPGDYQGLRQAGRPRQSLGNPLNDLSEFLRVRGLVDSFWSRPEHAGYRARWRAFLEAGVGWLDGEPLGRD